MPNMTLIVLLQFAATLYLIYRVNRLEQRLGTGGRPARRGTATTGDGKVVPLLREQVPVGPFGKGHEPPSDSPK